MEGGAIAMAELFGVITLSRTARQQGWLGKAAAGLHAVQGAEARTGRAVGSLDCGRRPAAFWRQASCRVTGFRLPNAEPLSRWGRCLV